MKKERNKNKEKDVRLQKIYGITLKEWENMFEEQHGVCWICGALPPSGRLSVDHIHIKGFKSMMAEEKKKYVRALLCYMCNTGLKGFEKTIDGRRNRQSLEGTYRYFQKFKLKGEL